jgi:hypothetical protein
MFHRPANRPSRSLILSGLAALALSACVAAPTAERRREERAYPSPTFRPIELETRSTRMDMPRVTVNPPDDRRERDNPPRTVERRPRVGSASPPDSTGYPPTPRPTPLPPPASTQGATDAFKRDLLRPEVDRMRGDDALGRLDPLQQRDLMRRENELRQLGDPLAR